MIIKRIYSIDFIKFFAAFAVVVIHAHSFEKVQFQGWDGEIIDLFLTTGARFAVPFFFIASGYFFGKKVKSKTMTFPFFKKKIWQIFKLYSIWTFFYLIYDLFFIFLSFLKGKENLGIAITQYFHENWSLASVFYYGNPTGARHLWFLTALIWSLVLVYIFTFFKQINGLLIGSLFLNLLGIFDVIQGMPSRETLFLGLFYTASGCWIALHEEKIKKIIPSKVIFFLIPFLGTIQVIERFLFFTGDYFISTIPLTWLLLILAIQFPEIGKSREITRIGSESVHIYLIHWFFIKITYHLVNDYGGLTLTQNLLWGIFFPIFVFGISYYTFYLFSKLKGNLESQ